MNPCGPLFYEPDKSELLKRADTVRSIRDGICHVATGIADLFISDLQARAEAMDRPPQPMSGHFPMPPGAWGPAPSNNLEEVLIALTTKRDRLTEQIERMESRFDGDSTATAAYAPLIDLMVRPQLDAVNDEITRIQRLIEDKQREGQGQEASV